MKKVFATSLTVGIFSALFLCSCSLSGDNGGYSSNSINYDGMEFDISLAHDGSLTAQTSLYKESFYQIAIFGTGPAIDYNSKNEVPWKDIATKVASVTIEEGITNIGDYYFSSSSARHFILPKTVTSVGDNSFPSDATIYTYGSEITNYENVYYYSETKPTKRGNYFHIVNGQPVIWLYNNKVFFIGNSFTYKQGTESDPDVPKFFKQIANNLGSDVEIDFVCKGSHTLTKFGDASDSMGAIVDNKLRTNQYDFVVLQEQSTTPINNYNTFNSAVKALKTKIDQTQEGAKTILYQTWSTPYNVETEPSKYGSLEDMEDALRGAYERSAKENGCTVSYVGKAFIYGYKNVDQEKYYLYDANDNRHQSALGAYLSAAVHVKTILGPEVSGCTEYCGLDQNGCKAYLGVADTVIK